MIAILLLCVSAGCGIYFGIVRPFLVPLTSRIPHGREYIPNIRSMERKR